MNPTSSSILVIHPTKQRKNLGGRPTPNLAGTKARGATHKGRAVWPQTVPLSQHRLDLSNRAKHTKCAEELTGFALQKFRPSLTLGHFARSRSRTWRSSPITGTKTS